MLLRDSLDDAVADVSADLHALSAASRRQGLAIRRHRRALTTVGSVVAVGALAAGGYALAPGAGGPDTAVATDQAAPAVSGRLSGDTAPITDQGAAAALADAVADVADGTFGRFQGDTYDEDGRVQEAMAALLFEPANGSGPAGQVFLNLQPAAMAGDSPYSCDDLAPQLTDCAVQQLPGGDTLRTYREDDDTEFGVGSQRVAAEVISPDRRLTVTVFAMNTNPWVDGDLRDQPVLTTEQLTEIAVQPWWSRTDLPVEYVEAGKALELYPTVATDD